MFLTLFRYAAPRNLRMPNHGYDRFWKRQQFRRLGWVIGLNAGIWAIIGIWLPTCPVRGGPFDTGGLWFFFVIKLFSTASLNVQSFIDLIKSKQFFSQGSNTKQFFSPFISLDSPQTPISSGVTTFTWTSHCDFLIRKAVVWNCIEQNS